MKALFLQYGRPSCWQTRTLLLPKSNPAVSVCCCCMLQASLIFAFMRSGGDKPTEDTIQEAIKALAKLYEQVSLGPGWGITVECVQATA